MVKLELTENEAWLVDFGSRMHGLSEVTVLELAQCIISKGVHVPDFSESELWAIRNSITPGMKLNEADSFTILRKIYRALLKLNNYPIPADKEIDMMERPENVSVVSYENNNKAENRAKDGTEDTCIGARD
jgi:hypothetical protein